MAEYPGVADAESAAQYAGVDEPIPAPPPPVRDVDADAIDLLARIDGRLKELVRYERMREQAQLWEDFRAAERHRSPAAALTMVLVLLLLVAVITDKPKEDR